MTRITARNHVSSTGTARSAVLAGKPDLIPAYQNGGYTGIKWREAEPRPVSPASADHSLWTGKASEDLISARILLGSPLEFRNRPHPQTVLGAPVWVQRALDTGPHQASGTRPTGLDSYGTETPSNFRAGANDRTCILFLTTLPIQVLNAFRHHRGSHST